MIVENGKIIEATRDELYHLYLADGWDDFTSFPDFLIYVEGAGVRINGGDEDGKDTAAMWEELPEPPYGVSV